MTSPRILKSNGNGKSPVLDLPTRDRVADTIFGFAKKLAALRLAMEGVFNDQTSDAHAPVFDGLEATINELMACAAESLDTIPSYVRVAAATAIAPTRRDSAGDIVAQNAEHATRASITIAQDKLAKLWGRLPLSVQVEHKPAYISADNSLSVAVAEFDKLAPVFAAAFTSEGR